MSTNPWGHRTAHNAPRQRPNMRGTSLYPMAAPHARQVAKNIAAKQIPNTWPIPRNRSKKSRGLRRNGNTCFRLSGLQALLHLPRFLQWIISHNSMRNGTRIFPCRPAHVIHAQLDLNMSSTTISSNKKIPSIDELPEKELTQLKKKLEKKEKKNPGSTLTDCPACAVKALAQFYWGIQNLNAGGVPDSLPFNNAELDRVHQVDNMLRQFTPGADTGAGNAQEDPEEMQTRLLTACLESVNYHLNENTAWKARYEALFILQQECFWNCPCGSQQVPPNNPAPDSIGFNNIAILSNGTPDSLEEAMRREFEPTPLSTFHCHICNSTQQRMQSTRIEGSPEYLRIKLSIVNSNGTPNLNPVNLPEVLNLSEYQAVGDGPPLLMYRLSSVLAHGGKHNAGHWVASVRGPQNVFYINDHLVSQRSLLELRANPQVYGGTGMHAVVLMYKRFEKKL